MKKNPAFVGFLLVLSILGIILLVYFNILDKKNGYVVANPSNKQLVIHVDDQQYTIAPQQNVRVSIEKGPHRIKYNHLGEEIDTIIDILSLIHI